jgi:hypothetical protein
MSNTQNRFSGFTEDELLELSEALEEENSDTAAALKEEVDVARGVTFNDDGDEVDGSVAPDCEADRGDTRLEAPRR